jgi:hypothetical protein
VLPEATFQDVSSPFRLNDSQPPPPPDSDSESECETHEVDELMATSSDNDMTSLDLDDSRNRLRDTIGMSIGHTNLIQY